MIDIGVASPSAQGQAMIRTETAASRAKATRGSGPQTNQAAKAASATLGGRRLAETSARPSSKTSRPPQAADNMRIATSERG